MEPTPATEERLTDLNAEPLRFRNAEDFQRWLDGLITKEELVIGLRRLDVAIANLETQLDAADASGPGAFDQKWYNKATHALKHNKINRSRVYDKIGAMNNRDSERLKTQSRMLESLRQITSKEDWERIVAEATTLRT